MPEETMYIDPAPRALSPLPAALLVLALVTAAVLLVYTTVASSPFHLDDGLYIVNNETIRSLGNFIYPSSTRHITYLSFALNYRFGGLSTTGYHAVNIVIHILNSFLVYFVVVLTASTPLMSGSSAGDNRNRMWAVGLFAALIFAVHPVQTEAVTYVSQRFASLATLFYLASFVLYLKWRLSSNTGRATSRKLFYAASITAALLAMYTKEISFTLPVVILLYELAFFKGTPLGSRVLYLVPHLGTMLIIPVVLFTAGAAGAEGAEVSTTILTTQMMELKHFYKYSYLVTQFTVIPEYLRLLVFPVRQNLYYDHHISTTFFDRYVLVSFAFLAVFFLYSLYRFFNAKKSGSHLLIFVTGGILWFFLTISVESSIIPIRDAMFEHRMYLPNVGGSVALSAAAIALSDYAGRRLKSGKMHRVGYALLFLTVLSLGTAAYTRNQVWKDDVRLWEDTVQKSPHSTFAHLNLAQAYSDKGNTVLEEAELKKAVNLQPGYFYARRRLGIYFYNFKRFDEALTEFEAAAKIDPSNAEIHTLIGNIHFRKGLIGEAIEDYTRAVLLDPDSFEARYGLAQAHEAAGNRFEAMESYFIAAELTKIRALRLTVEFKMNQLMRSGK